MDSVCQVGVTALMDFLDFSVMREIATDSSASMMATVILDSVSVLREFMVCFAVRCTAW